MSGLRLLLLVGRGRCEEGFEVHCNGAVSWWVGMRVKN